MKRRFVQNLTVYLLVVLIAVVILGDIAVAADDGIPLPDGTLNANDVLELFSDKTVESVTAVRGRTSISYYAPNGEVRQQRKGVTRTGKWRVLDNGRMCLQMDGLPEKCRIIVNENGIYKKYIVKKSGEHQHSVTYRSFRDGNPLGL